VITLAGEDSEQLVSKNSGLDMDVWQDRLNANPCAKLKYQDRCVDHRTIDRPVINPVR